MLSIVTPVLNGANFIEKNIQSILRLKIPYEHIVVDGGSTDGTLAIINKYPHIKLIAEMGKEGMYSAINQGFDIASGSYFSYVNCDDQVIPEGFEKMYEIISNTNIRTDVVYSGGFYYYLKQNKYEHLKGSSRYAKYFLKKGIMPFVQPSCIFTKTAYEKLNGFDAEKFKICGDLDFFYRLSLIDGAKFRRVPVNSSIFLKYGDSLGDRSTDIYLNELKLGGFPSLNIFTKVLFFICTKF
jgi:glycosyltransferase involved in cell wall biosynthesis